MKIRGLTLQERYDLFADQTEYEYSEKEIERVLGDSGVIGSFVLYIRGNYGHSSCYQGSILPNYDLKMTLLQLVRQEIRSINTSHLNCWRYLDQDEYIVRLKDIRQ